MKDPSLVTFKFSDKNNLLNFKVAKDDPTWDQFKKVPL